MDHGQPWLRDLQTRGKGEQARHQATLDALAQRLQNGARTYAAWLCVNVG